MNGAVDHAGAGIDQGSDQPAADGYTIAQAAALLGVHPNTIRRKIRRGLLTATMAEGPGGQEYRIPAGALGVVTPPSATGHTTGSDQGLPWSDPVVNPRSNAGSTPGESLQTLERAREMAAYTEQLLAPYVRRLEEQAEEIGRLKAENATLALLRDTAAPPVEPDRRRPWWRFWG